MPERNIQQASEQANQAWRQYGGNLSVIELEPHLDLRLRRKVLNTGSALTLNLSDSGAQVVFNAATAAVTLPALPADMTNDLGVFFEFVVTTTATAQTITAQAGDILTGGVSVMSTAAGAENDAFSADATDDLIMTMNGTTQGGIIGSWCRFTAISATRWAVIGGTIGSGTLVAPFS